MGKVFHVDEDTHLLVTEHCKRVGLKAKDWVCATLQGALRVGTPAVGAKSLAEARETVAAAKKPLPQEIPPSPDANDLFAKPPFWKTRTEVTR